jgi:hypothetical protein
MSTAEIKTNVWRYVKHYAYGCFAKSLNAGIAAAYGIVGAAAGSALFPQKIQTPNWEMAGSIFATAFCVTALGYFKDHPLPQSLESTPPVDVPKP